MRDRGRPGVLSGSLAEREAGEREKKSAIFGRAPFLALTLAAAALLAAPLPSHAAAEVTVSLTQIRATERGSPKDIDPSLTEFRRQLENYPYRVFRRVGSDSQVITEGQSGTFAVQGGFSVSVRPSSGSGQFLVLDVTMKDQGGAERFATKVKIRDGGSVLIGKEFEVGQGSLFLAFTAKKR